MVITRSKSQKMTPEEISELLDSRFEKIKNQIVSEVSGKIESSLLTFVKDHVKEVVHEALQKQDSIIEEMSSTIAMLQQHVSVLKEAAVKNSTQVDELEQYGRRLCLRIEGVPVEEKEKSDEVRDKVLTFMENDPDNDISLNIPEVVVDRAHRIGQVHDNKEGPRTQSIIVRFSTFRHRTMFYYERKGLEKKFGIRIRLDMTRTRYGIYKTAINLVKEKANIKYVYCDVNCRLKVKFSDGSEKVFDSIKTLKDLIE